MKVIQRKTDFKEQVTLRDFQYCELASLGPISFYPILNFNPTLNDASNNMIIYANSTLFTFQLGLNRIFHLVGDVKEGI